MNLVVFILFFLLFYPIYDSAEDTHVLYMLAGGYGEAPTEMAHFNYGIHPILGWIVKSLFQLTNKVNWYSIALIAAHYISCTVILTAVVRRKNTTIAYLSYAALFIIFEGYFLLYLDFTGASAVLGITALLYLLIHAWARSLGYRQCIIATCLFILASFYRIHSILPLAGIALPFFLFTLPKREKWRSAVTILVAGLCILLFNFIHQSWYKAKKSDWAKEEAYRQKIFPFFNEASTMKHPAKGDKWYTEYQLVTKGMIMDTSLVPAWSLNTMYHDLKKEGRIHWNVSAEWLKWFYLNNRLFFAAFIVLFVLYGWRRKILTPAIIATVLLALGYGFLLFNYKAPPYILISGLSFICFAMYLYDHTVFQKKYYRLAAIVILLLLSAWGIFRLIRSSELNSDYTFLFRKNYTELAAHRDKLYIGLESIYAHKYYIFDTPARYPLDNILHGESFLSEHYKSILRRFNIPDMKAIFSAPNVLFWGLVSDEQKHHFDQIAGRNLQFVQQMDYNHGSVWKIVQE